MNRSRIEWTDFTWNPVTGCKHNCPYCYARKQALRFAGDVRMNLNDPRCIGDTEKMLFVLDKPFESKTKGHFITQPFGFYPTFHTYRMDWPGKVATGENVFVCSMSDLFGEWIPLDWITRVFAHCYMYPQHNYLFLTKNPRRYAELMEHGDLPTLKNFWFGSTATGPSAPVFTDKRVNTFVSVEPLLEAFPPGCDDFCNVVNWVIIGAESGNRHKKVVPQREWVDTLVSKCKRAGTPVFLKDSLEGIMGGDMIQERPAPLQLHPVGKKLHAQKWAYCCVCKADRPMKEMVALLFRLKRDEGAKRLGYACPECFELFKSLLDSPHTIQALISMMEEK